ncbi:MAG: alpha/beta fold hydrolase [Armatimonadota bacterium]|nr:alpha/beta fold hydrolase [Armatimonadota bacterium]MDR7450875.1 alpha/beta fold hydrolase [Armatimonadota bacterium]MDR7465797.1 alpha/beta fold hydrolase [Armatimonadota bacterium]MDR7493705.1 alpha/beta fold hydrolase [Armatimonadota bacterium]MDR7500573.1 alpha/beta fold hydrolase [Armatimonadota bacterium]
MRLRNLGLLAVLAPLLWAATAPAAPAPQAVTFRSRDGITLRGRLWSGGSTAVVFSHMFGTTQSIWFDLADYLAGQGYTVLTFDFRGVGSSSGRLVIRNVYRDTMAAAAFVRSDRPRRVVLIGASMGGTASIVAAAHEPVDGLVVIASGTRFQGLDARPHLGQLRMPKLFIAGSRDLPFNTSARVMFERTPPPKQLMLVPTALHGTYMLRSARHREQIYRTISTFLRAAVR